MSKISTKENLFPIIVIVGPTSSGKTDLSIKIAKARNGEVISADSRQVYKGMDLGSGKITKKEMQGIPHHLIDVVNPNTRFDVTKFKKMAQRAIKEIHFRGHVPIIVGGTGFWIDALIYNYDFPEVKADEKLRARLEKKSVDDLYKELVKKDPQRASTIDPKNKRRLVRALEIVITTGKPVPKIPQKNSNNSSNSNSIILYDREGLLDYDVKWLGIDMDRARLDRRIKKRLIERLDQGMIAEIQKLHLPRSKGGYGVSWRRLEELGLEYRYVSRMLRRQINMTEMIHQLEIAIIQYSKRQMTWFKRNKNIRWINPLAPPYDKVEGVEKLLRK